MNNNANGRNNVENEFKYYEYEVVTQNGKHSKSVMAGASKDEVIQSLKSRGVQIVSVTEMHDFLGLKGRVISSVGKVSKSDLADFFAQMAFMLSTDIRIYNALTILKDYGAKKKTKSTADRLSSDVRQGLSFSEALGRNRMIFENYMVQQIKSGEESGDTPYALKNLVIQLEREVKFQKKIKGALAYPIFVIVLIIVAVGIMLTKVLPQITNTLQSLGSELPSITLMVIAASDFCIANWWKMIIGAVLTVAAIITLLKVPKIKYTVDKVWLLYIPVFGKLQMKIEIARFFRSMSSMLRCGVSMISAMDIAKSTVKNTYLSSVLSIVQESIQTEGWTLPFAMSQTHVFPEIVIQLMEVGVAASKVPEVMDRVATQYEEESEATINRLTAMIQPAMLLILGGIVGIIAAAIVVPMMSVMDAVDAA